MSMQRAIAPDPYDFLPTVPSFPVVSSDLTSGGTLGMDHVNDAAGGGNRSPHLSWSDAPAGTAGFAVTCLDPDAPTGSGVWHWVLFDLPADVTELPAGAGAGDSPAVGVHARNDLGSLGFAGAAPPPGDHPHRYMFVVHALDTASIGLGSDASPALVGFHLTAHTLGRGVLTVTYAH